MVTEKINASLLVNRGLQATAFLGHTDFGLTAPAVTDVVPQAITADVLGSFRDMALDPQVQLAAPELAGLFGAFASTTDLASWAINSKYAELGGADGILGRTLDAVSPTPNHAGFFRSFQSGAIYWHPHTGAHALHGPILARWRELGAEAGLLGFPSSDVTPGADVRAEGLFAHFQGGSVYWSAPSPLGGIVAGVSLANTALGVEAMAMARTTVRAATVNPVNRGALDGSLQVDVNRPLTPSSAGAFEVHGAIREKYLALGAEASILGYPHTDELGTPDGRGRFNHFQGGSIYWTADTGAHEVHGLIRDRWSALGWERNPQLGYPITDELIPDPRIGHRRPEVIKKPVASLPSGVIKLPAAASAAGFPASVVNTPLLAKPVVASAPAAMGNVARAARLASSAPVESAGAIGALSAPGLSAGLGDAQAVPDTRAGDLLGQVGASLALDPSIAAILAGPASTAAPERSVNRFADFESGVLFWFRGATTASVLSPLAATRDGTPLAFSGADIAAIAIARLGRPSVEFGNAQLLSTSFVGTTGCSFDGAQVHNRRHRLQLILQGVENTSVSGPLGLPIPTLGVVTAAVELQVEAWFDAARRRIALALTDWSISHATSSGYGAMVEAGLRNRLDPLLWRAFELMTLPDTDGGSPIAVLSVKTLANGSVVVFVEPRQLHLLDGIGDLANAVSTTVIHFAQPA